MRKNISRHVSRVANHKVTRLLFGAVVVATVVHCFLIAALILR